MQIVKTLSPEETTEFWNRDTLKEVGKGDKLLFGSTGPVSRVRVCGRFVVVVVVVDF